MITSKPCPREVGGRRRRRRWVTSWQARAPGPRCGSATNQRGDPASRIAPATPCRSTAAPKSSTRRRSATLPDFADRSRSLRRRCCRRRASVEREGIDNAALLAARSAARNSRRRPLNAAWTFTPCRRRREGVDGDAETVERRFDSRVFNVLLARAGELGMDPGRLGMRHRPADDP